MAPSSSALCGLAGSGSGRHLGVPRGHSLRRRLVHEADVPLLRDQHAGVVHLLQPQRHRRRVRCRHLPLVEQRQGSRRSQVKKRRNVAAQFAGCACRSRAARRFATRTCAAISAPILNASSLVLFTQSGRLTGTQHLRHGTVHGTMLAGFVGCSGKTQAMHSPCAPPGQLHEERVCVAIHNVRVPLRVLLHHADGILKRLPRGLRPTAVGLGHNGCHCLPCD